MQSSQAFEGIPEGVVDARSYWRPTLVVVSAWLEHAPFAFWLVQQLHPKVFVELGTHNGFSFFTFCEGAQRAGIDLDAWAIDTWEGDDYAGFYGEDVYIGVSELRDRSYSASAHLLRGYFDEFVDQFKDGSIDLLHIDGRHSYDDVKHDYETWLPKMSSRGVVLFHDIAEHENGFGVWRVWEQVAANYPSFAFEHGHGLGVAYVGTDETSADFMRLLGASASDSELIRSKYQELGEFVSRQHVVAVELAEVKKELKEISEIAAAREVVVAEMLSSSSWKVTKPLRALGRFLPRNARAD